MPLCVMSLCHWPLNYEDFKSSEKLVEYSVCSFRIQSYPLLLLLLLLLLLVLILLLIITITECIKSTDNSNNSTIRKALQENWKLNSEM